MDGRLRRALGVAVACAALELFASWWTTPPRAVPADAPASVFSAGRARAHLESIAQRPHPMGSADHARVRVYLIDQLRALGLEPQVQAALAVRAVYDPAHLGEVKNVVARMRGTRPSAASDKALLLMAHYDSRGMTPGASDDGYGVAALLETARALHDTSPPARDVLFLFTDGEEQGLLGAAAFAAEHRWAKDVGAILNVDARGSSGASLMFQTGDQSGALVAALGASAPHLAANSLSQAIYERMPNDTDLSVFLPRTPSLNFANVGGLERYHSPTDTVANADLRTLQQDGEQILATARALAAGPMPPEARPNPTYFDVGPFFVRYPRALDLPLAVVAGGLLVAFVALGRRRGVLRASAVGVSMIVALGLVVGGALLSLALWLLAQRLHADYRLMNAARPLLKDLYFAAFVAATAGLAFAAIARASSRLRPLELFAGAAAVFVVLALLCAIALPGGSFLFTWPALAGLAVGLAVVARGVDLESSVGAAFAIAMSAPALVVTAPFVPQLFEAFGPMAAPAIGGVGALLVVGCAPVVALLLAPAPRLFPRAVIAMGVLVYLAANGMPPFDVAYPRPDTALYAVDADARRAFWITPDPTPSPWCAASFAGATKGSAPLPFPLEGVLAAPAPAAASEGAPAIRWVREPSAGGEALLRVIAPEGTELLAVHVEGVASAAVDGRPVPVRASTLAFRLYAPPRDGVEIKVTGATTGKLVVRVASQRPGFPAGVSPGQRPADSMPKPGMLPPWDHLLESDTTLVAASSKR